MVVCARPGALSSNLCRVRRRKNELSPSVTKYFCILLKAFASIRMVRGIAIAPEIYNNALTFAVERLSIIYRPDYSPETGYVKSATKSCEMRIGMSPHLGD
jgi:hypothetical protein